MFNIYEITVVLIWIIKKPFMMQSNLNNPLLRITILIFMYCQADYKSPPAMFHI